VAGLELDRARIEALLARAADTLDGDWMLVGGALAALWFSPERTTQDIDLVKRASSNDDRLRLMEVAEAEGLPVESVNSAADFVLRRIPDWTSGAVLLRSGKRAHIYRPSATVFLLSKLRRLGEQDLDDCIALMGWCAAHGEPLDRDRIRTAIDALPETTDRALADRRLQLAGALGG
jgi:hypothetical protein